MTDTAVHADQTARQHPAHPLDPATAAEYLAGREILAAAGLLAEPTRFAYYGLEEPSKDDVLGGRRAAATTGGCARSCSTPAPASPPTPWYR